ncbi:MAG: hypothetical protein LBU73_08045, partial [Helicobacteraceae bacterium]|nr:hypothetical protein [Helicobacteraceae bacterium]
RTAGRAARGTGFFAGIGAFLAGGLAFAAGFWLVNLARDFGGARRSGMWDIADFPRGCAVCWARV